MFEPEEIAEKNKSIKGVKVDPKKAIKLFRNKINFKIQANTFDAKHMDKILRTEFCKTKAEKRFNDLSLTRSEVMNCSFLFYFLFLIKSNEH